MTTSLEPLVIPWWNIFGRHSLFAQENLYNLYISLCFHSFLHLSRRSHIVNPALMKTADDCAIVAHPTVELHSSLFACHQHQDDQVHPPSNPGSKTGPPEIKASRGTLEAATAGNEIQHLLRLLQEGAAPPSL